MKARISAIAETPAPNRWPRGSIIRAFGRRALASAGIAAGIGRCSFSSRRGGVVVGRYQITPTGSLGYGAAAGPRRYAAHWHQEDRCPREAEIKHQHASA